MPKIQAKRLKRKMRPARRLVPISRMAALRGFEPLVTHGSRPCRRTYQQREQ